MRKQANYSQHNNNNKDDDSMSSSDSSQDDQQHTNGNSKYSSAAVQLAQLQNNGCKNAFLTVDGKLDLQNLANMANVAGQVMTIPSSAALLCGQDGQMYFPGDLPYKLQSSQAAVAAAAAAAHLMSQNSTNNHHNHSRNSNNSNNTGNNSSGMESISEESTRKRELRLLKNREAARECRRKKKEYIKCLENRVAVLETQNKALIDELKSLKELYCQSEVGSKNH